MTPGKIAVAIVSAIVAVAAFGLIVGGGALLWALGTQRDADGFFTSPTYELDTEGYALVSVDVDIAARPGDWIPSGLAEVRFDVESPDGAVFVGIGDTDDIDEYLGRVERTEVTRLGFSSDDIASRAISGTPPSGPPGAQDFWVATSEGSGFQGISWDVEAGEWGVVVMNADGSAGVDIEAVGAVRMDILFPIALAILVFGLFLGVFATVMLVWATRSKEAETTDARVQDVALVRHGYPVTVEGHLDPGLSRWMWLVKWFLAIPHVIVLAVLGFAYMLATIGAFFAILFTGRYPRGIFDFNVGVMRWSWRVGFYAFSAIGTDQYPPFSLSDEDYPAHLDVEYPETLSRGLVLVKWWLLAIPHYVIVGLFTSGLIWWSTEIGGDTVMQVGGGLIGILVLIAGGALLFVNRYPQGLFDLVMGLNRWSYRVWAYAGLMRDEYPPFRLDLGGDEPSGGHGGGPATPPATDEVSKPFADSTM